MCVCVCERERERETETETEEGALDFSSLDYAFVTLK